jgi:hypothetical protein
MPSKHPNTARVGGPGASHEDRKHPDKPRSNATSNREKRKSHHSKISGGGGEKDYHHTHAPSLNGGRGG